MSNRKKSILTRREFKRFIDTDLYDHLSSLERRGYCWDYYMRMSDRNYSHFFSVLQYKDLWIEVSHSVPCGGGYTAITFYFGLNGIDITNEVEGDGDDEYIEEIEMEVAV